MWTTPDISRATWWIRGSRKRTKPSPCTPSRALVSHLIIAAIRVSDYRVKAVSTRKQAWRRSHLRAV